jgi:hypothetical protein
MSESEKTTRREVFKKAVFVTPIIMTFPALASFARAASGRPYRGGNNNDQGENNNNQN